MHSPSDAAPPSRTPIFHLDAFSSHRFRGNPAAVMPMAHFPADSILQALAAENNLAETAFIVPEGDEFRIRWFTPTVEVPLCGHATLASAAVVFERLELQRTSVVFHSVSGPLTVRRSATGYVMNFPARFASVVTAPPGMIEALGARPIEVAADEFNYLAVLESAAEVRSLAPDIAAIARLDRSGVIVTARGDDGFDFVSRYFAPRKGIAEDSVTGGAHCSLAPFWASRLNSVSFRAYQASARGGTVVCRVVGDRVELEGACVFYLEGTVEF